MKYMLLLFGDESSWEGLSEDQVMEVTEAYGKYSEDLEAAGAFVSGEGLQPSSTATTLRMSGGERLLTDGPFAESKEQVGGFYVLDCKDLDEALEWAEKCPASQDGTIEIRPVLNYEAMYQGEAPGSDEVAR